MQLRKLNSLIRKNEGSVKLRFATAHGSIVVGLVKSELLAALAELHPDNTAETGLTLVEGRLRHENDVDADTVQGERARAVIATEGPDQIDIEQAIAATLDVGDLLGVEDLLGEPTPAAAPAALSVEDLLG